MAEIVGLEDAVRELMADGVSLALEGFTHLVPFAAGHEIIRSGVRDLELIRMTPDLIYDQMIGAGLARKLLFSWGGNPGVGSLHRLREAIERSSPTPVEIEEHNHFEFANRYVAGASGVPFAITRSGGPTDMDAFSTASTTLRCPFTGETVRAVKALRPDVGVIHAQQSDRDGNVQLWGITGVQKEAVLSSRRSLVTVEEIVDELQPRPHAVVLPSWATTYVAMAPGGAAPSYAQDYYERDNQQYVDWDRISRSRDEFERWLDAMINNRPGTAVPA